MLLIIFLGINAVFSVDNTTFDSLSPTKNCQSDSKIIKNLTNNVIDVKYKSVNKTKVVENKAVKIFNYVNKKKFYSFYYNTCSTALGMVKKGSGNCVDKTHLLIAMCRSVKIPARYVHAKVTMKSGNTYGHVYAEVNW